MDVLPTKPQIEAIADPAALCDIKDSVELAIDHIQAQLEFSDRDEAWANTAINALALHRHVARLIDRRIEALARAPARAAGGPHERREEDCDPLTREVLHQPPDVDVAALATVEAVDEWQGWLTDAINAVSSDREDEIARKPGDRDERFCAATGRVLRTLKALRVQLQNRRGQISKAAAVAFAQARDESRERLFIDIARETLEPSVYREIWTRVDARHAQEIAA